jgi:recombinational DNA repair protein RecT
MGDRLKNLQHSTSNVLEVIRKLGSPEVHESLEKIHQTTQEAKDIMESLRKREMVKNFDNIRLTAEAIESTSRRLEASVLEIKKTQILERASETLVAVRGTLSSPTNKNNMSEVTSSVKETLVSLKSLIDELRLTVSASKKSGLLSSAGEAAKEASDLYRSMRE